MIIKKTLKSTVSIIAALLIFMLSITFYADRSNATNTSVEYIVFNAQTGEYLRSYTIDPLPENVNSREIIESDDRVVDWSKNGVVKLMHNYLSMGTGFVIGSHTIATAAHCVRQSVESGYVLTEILLFDNNGNISLRATPVESHCAKYCAVGHTDYALITVKEDLTDYMCFNLGITTDNFLEGNQEIKTTGFPSVGNHNGNHTMYTSIGNVIASNTIDPNNKDVIFFDANIIGGNSGGPLYIEESRCGKKYNTVIGIVSGSGGDAENPYRFANRIDTNTLCFLTRNSNLNY